MAEDTKGVIRNLKSKKDRQYSDQKKKNKGTNSDLQITKEKTNGEATRIPLKFGGELRYSGKVSSSCSTSNTCRYY